MSALLLLALLSPAAGSDSLVVSTAWLAAHARDADLSLLHVGRDRAAYDKGHIPGARFVMLSDIVIAREDTPNELPPARDLVEVFEKAGIGDTGRVIVYGEDNGLLAARLFFTLDYLGHGERVALLDGGLEQWRREGRPVETSESPLARRPFTPLINADALVTLDVVRDISWARVRPADVGWVLIDARPDAQFTGAEAGEGVTRPGHIPGASGIFWERFLVSRDNPVLRPMAELRGIFEAVGAKRDTRVVTYCRTGVQASFAYFVARYLGYDVSMYDGSYIEWSRATTDVER